MKTSKKNQEKHVGGRPRKFAETSRPITVTLPDRILKSLNAVHKDRARAIVKVTEAVMSNAGTMSEPVKLVEIEPGLALIVTGPSASLQKIPWLRLVEIAPARYLLSIPTGTSPEMLEVAILDLIENLTEESEYERRLLGELRRRLSHLRRERKMSKSEIIFVSI